METDHQAELIRQQIRQYAERKGLELTEEEEARAFDGIKFWMDDALPGAVSDSVYFARGAGV